MKNPFLPILLLTISFASIFPSCRKKPGKTFTWEGTVYKGMSDEPMEFQPLKLTASVQPALMMNPTELELAEGRTDKNGYFMLSYSEITTPEPRNDHYRGGLSLFLAEHRSFPLTEEAPRNINIQRKFAEIDHARLLLDVSITSTMLPDTFYYITGGGEDNEYLRFKYFSCSTHNPVGYYAVPVTSPQFQVLTRFRWESTWDNQPYRSIPIYLANSIMALDSLYCLDIELVNAKKIMVFPRGFPKVDSLNISLP